MPRTKRPVRQQEKQTERNELTRTINKIVNEEKKSIDSFAQMECGNVEVAYKILLGSISKNYLNKTIGELKTELRLKEVTNDSLKRHSVTSTSHDDGYLTENSSQSSGDHNRPRFGHPSTASRRSRSADACVRRAAAPAHGTAPRATHLAPPRPPPSASHQHRRRTRSVYTTPMYNKNPTSYPAITPKVAPQASMMLLRQPRQGEMVVSMSGSPVMVPTCYNMQQDEKANCNIMLEDGTMLSLQPREFRQSQAFVPYSLMDLGVLKQLKTLKNNLETIVKQGEKVVK